MFEKLFKRNTKLLPISSIFIVLTLIICLSFQIYQGSLLKNSKELNLITFNQKEVNKNVKISDIKNILLFKDDYYIILNKDSFYIAKLTGDEVQNIRKGLDKNNTYTLYGISKIVDDKTKEDFTDTFNKLKKEETITSSEYNNSFGYMYLDQKTFKESLNKKSNIVIPVSLSLVTIGIILSTIFIHNNNNNYRLLRTLSKSEISKLNKELNNSQKIKSLYITDNYILKARLSLDLIKYDNIIFAYDANSKTIIYTKDLVCHKIKSNIDLLDLIKSKNKNVLIDNTEKNKETLLKKYNLTID